MAVHFVYDGGSAPTGVGSGSSYDGYTASTGDRFCTLANANSSQDRGIYEVTGVGTSARASDADASSSLLLANVFQLSLVTFTVGQTSS